MSLSRHTAAFTPAQPMPRLRSGSRPGFTVIELVIVIVIIAILAAIAIPQFRRTRDETYAATMRSDLHNLAAEEQQQMNEKGAYSSDLAALEFSFSPGVHLVGPIVVSPRGWSAKVQHERSIPKSCALFVGDAPPVPPATVAGTIACGE